MENSELKKVVKDLIQSDRQSQYSGEVAKCSYCSKRDRVRCEIYPQGIPKEILANRKVCSAFQEK